MPRVAYAGLESKNSRGGVSRSPRPEGSVVCKTQRWVLGCAAHLDGHGRINAVNSDGKHHVTPTPQDKRNPNR